MRSARPYTYLLVLVALTLALAGCDWGQFGASPANRFFNPFELALNAQAVGTLHAAWSVPCSCSKPFVVGGSVYVTDDPFSSPLILHVFDAATGAPRWSQELPAEGSLAAVANGLVYVSVMVRHTVSNVPLPGELIALDAATGAPRWTMTPPPGDASSVIDNPVLVDGPLAFVTVTEIGSDARYLSAIDTQGRVVWTRSSPAGSSNVAADPGRTIYELTGSSYSSTGVEQQTPRLVGYGEADGHIVSDVTPEINGVTSSRIEFANGLVYGFQFVNSGVPGVSGAGLYALRPDTGALVWHSSTARLWAVGSDVVIGSDPNGNGLIGLDPQSGAIRWSVPDPGSNTAADVAIAGNLVFEASGMAFTAWDADSGARLATVPSQTFTAAITPANGRVFDVALDRLTVLAP